MSTIPGKIKVLTDAAISLTGSVASTQTGVAQNKGTATDLLLTVYCQPVGGVAVAGTFIYTLLGANVTTPALSNWTAVTPDKGTLANSTASGAQVVHAAQLQYQYYKIYISQGAASTGQILTHFAYVPVQDSLDATVA